VILKSSREKEQANEFLNFLKEPDTMALMKEYGFLIPNDKAAAQDNMSAPH
jgi:spermidine/putrescine-binding protein